MTQTQNDTREFRIERLEIQKEDTESELKELTFTIQQLEGIKDTTKSRDTRSFIDKSISGLEEQREFLEGSLSEIEGSIEFVKGGVAKE